MYIYIYIYTHIYIYIHTYAAGRNYGRLATNETPGQELFENPKPEREANP